MSSSVADWRPCEECERKDICCDNEECWLMGEINPVMYDADSDDEYNDPRHGQGTA